MDDMELERRLRAQVVGQLHEIGADLTMADALIAVCRQFDVPVAKLIDWIGLDARAVTPEAWAREVIRRRR